MTQTQSVTYLDFSARQSEVITTMIARTRGHVLVALQADGSGEAEARAIVDEVRKSGLFNLYGQPLAAAAHALARTEQALSGLYDLHDAAMHCGDAQCSLRTQIVQIGAPALRLIESFAKLQAVLLLA